MLIESLEKSLVFEKAALGLAGKVLKSISGKDFKVIDVEEDLNFPILTIRDSEFFRFSWLGESEDGLEKIDDLGLSLILTYSSKSRDIPIIIPDFEFKEGKDQFEDFQNTLRKFGFNEPSSYIYSFSDSLTESVEALRTNYSITNPGKDSIKFKTRSRWITRITKIEEDLTVIGDNLIIGITEIYDSHNKILKRTVTLYPDSGGDENDLDLKPTITILQDITSLRIANDYELDLFYKISRWEKLLSLPRHTAIEVDTVTGNLKEPEKYTPSEKPLKS